MAARAVGPRGRVADPSQTDQNTEAIRSYNQLAAKARGYVTTTLPLRDGVSITTRAPKA